jgi:hypothetical protein
MRIQFESGLSKNKAMIPVTEKRFHKYLTAIAQVIGLSSWVKTGRNSLFENKIKTSSPGSDPRGKSNTDPSRSRSETLLVIDNPLALTSSILQPPTHLETHTENGPLLLPEAEAGAGEASKL